MGSRTEVELETLSAVLSHLAQGRDSQAADMLAKMKRLLQSNRQLQRQARELRSAHTRVEKLERQVAVMQEEIRTSAQTAGSDSQALGAEHSELSKLVADAQAATSAALQETRLNPKP